MIDHSRHPPMRRGGPKHVRPDLIFFGIVPGDDGVRPDEAGASGLACGPRREAIAPGPSSVVGSGSDRCKPREGCHREIVPKMLGSLVDAATLAKAIPPRPPFPPRAC